MPVDINVLKDKLTSLKVVSKTTTIEKEVKKKDIAPSVTRFRAVYVNGCWYGHRNNKCYLVAIKYCDIGNIKVRYEVPKKDSVLTDEDRILEYGNTDDYYVPNSTWTFLRKDVMFKGNVVNNIVIVEVESF